MLARACVTFFVVAAPTLWSNTTCPDGSNSDTDDGDGFTCLSNLAP